MLLAALLLTVAVGAYAVGVPDRLALGGGELPGSESATTDATLGAELGYEPEPAFVVVLTAGEPVPAASAEVTVESLRGEIESIAGVGAVGEGRRSSGGALITVDVHLLADADPETVVEVGDALEELDPGPFELLVGGAAATEEGARQAALDEAPELLALAAALAFALLAGLLGLRPGLAALLGILLATAATAALLGLLGELLELQAVATVAAASLAVLLSIQSAATLVARYREEAATLGAGAEALEYSLRIVLRGVAVGGLGAALVGAALLLIPIDFVRSIGAGVILAAIVAPPLGLLPVAAVLTLRPAEGVGGPLPLVADDAVPEGAAPGFRRLLELGRSRRRGVVAVVPLLVAAALVPAVLGSDAIGLSSSELPAEMPAAEAGAEIAGGLGAGATGPLVALTSGPAEAPTVTIYRHAVSGLDEIGSVGPAVTAGRFATFAATVAAWPQSLAAQQAAGDLRALPSPSPSLIGGQPAELLDSAGRLGGDLPLTGLLALIAAAALAAALLRSATGPAVAIAALLAPLAGIAAMLAVFGEGRLTGLLGYESAGAPHLQSFVIVGAVLLAVGLARSTDLAAALREERALGGGAAGSLARSVTLTLAPVAVASLVGVAVAGVWLGSDLLAGKELAVGLTAGLLADLLLARTLLAPALARLTS